MTTTVYHIPVFLVAAYGGRRVIVRAHDPAELVRALPQSDHKNLVGVQLLSLAADADALADWGYAVPVELAMLHPETEFPLLYRHAKLLDKHPMRVAIPAVPGFSQAVKIATSLQFSVKLEVGQPDPPAVEELRTVADFYLHHSSVSQPIEYFHSALLSFYHRNPVTLWDIQEEDPVYLRYVTEEGRETVARPLVNGSVGSMTGDLDSFVATLTTELLAGRGECTSCEFFANCGGYFKWPRKEYSCDGVKTVFRALREAAGELEHDLTAFVATKTEAAR
jgi:hypothetical protein